MQREQFTFYRSFWEALKALPKKDQLPFVMAVCSYAFGEESKSLTGRASAAFLLVKPILDKASKKAENGKLGGRKRKANGKQTGSQKEGEKEIEEEGEGEGEGEDECFMRAHARDPDLAAVNRAYMNRIDPTPSPSSMDELAGYVKLMGKDCCLKAIDAALDAKAPTWNYIRRVLQAKASQGVRCLADWDRIEQAREELKKRGSDGNSNAAGDKSFRGFKAKSALDDAD